MEKKGESGSYPREKLKLLTGLSRALLFIALFVFPNEGFGQEKRFTFEYKHVPVTTIYLYIEKNSDYSFVYNTQEIQRIGLKDYKFENATIQEILDHCLKGTGLEYEIRDKHVIIRRIQEIRSPRDMQQIRGRVVGKDSIALPGVTVLLKGTSMGITTDTKGYYVLYIPKQEDAVLVFSFVGMKTQEMPCGNRSIINVVMEEDVTAMEEVVVTGYQTLRKSEVVGSVTTIKASDIMMPAYTSIDQMLQGRVAGMMVMNTSSRVGTNPKIRIRGSATILGNQDPLWVVDGIIQPDPIPIDRNDAMVNDLKDILGNQISWLNPADIETITVLKDASATAIYGSKAANGVIVITTKRGKSDRLTINYRGNFTFRARPTYDLFNLMNSRERIQFSREAYAAGALYHTAPVANLHSYEGIVRMLNEKQLTHVEAMSAVQRLESMNTDWFKLLTRNAFSHNHNVSISGGTAKVLYNVSIGFNDQAGIELNNDASGLNGRLNLTVELHPKVRVDVSLSGSRNKTWGYAADVNPMNYARNTSRAVPACDEEGNRYFLEGQEIYPLNRNPVILGYNILNEIDHSYSKNKNTLLNGSLNLTWDILPWLKYEFVGGVSENSRFSESYAGEQTYFVAKKYRGYDFGSVKYDSDRFKAAMLPFGGVLYNGEADVSSWNIQNKINIQKTFKTHHHVNVLLGTEVFSTKTADRGNTVYGYTPERGEKIMKPTPPKEIIPIGGGNVMDSWGIYGELYNNGAWRRVTQTDNTFSLFATLAYSFMNRYVLNASMRNDASNRFGQDQNKRFDPTYSFGLSWNIAQESWLKSISPVLNQFTLRATYGIQGNAVSSISPDLIARQEGIKNYYGEYMVTISRLPNPDLSWERTKTWNFGLDLQLIQWVTMNVEYYKKRSNNIVSQMIALEYGRSSMEINGGRIENSGVEYSLNITPIRTKNWGLTIGLNSSKNWNKAKTKSIEELDVNSFIDGSSTKVLKEGYALSSFWSFDFKGLNPENGMPEFNGIYQLDADGNIVMEEGKFKLADFQGDITEFLVYSGKSEPDFTGGLTTRLRWKGLTFGANFSLLLGAKRRLPNPYPADFKIPASNVNLNRDLIKRWKKPGDELTTDIPAVYTGRVEEYQTLPNGARNYSLYGMWANSNVLVADASFLRCQQMSLNWNIDEKWCARWGLKSLGLNFTVNNVFVMASSRFQGFDPELGDSIQPKTYSLGINVGF